MDPSIEPLHDVLDQTCALLERVRNVRTPQLAPEEVGRVSFVGNGIVRVDGLPGVQSQELVRFPGDRLGMAFNLDLDEVGVILLDRAQGLHAGVEVRRTLRVLDVPVGETLLGRVVDGIGRPIDGQGPIRAVRRLPVKRPAAAIMDRAPVTVPFQTGIKVIDTLIPIGRGQRQLVLGDRQTGKTAIAVDAMINQREKQVLCVYCAIGQRSSSVARVIEDLKAYGAIEHTVIVATTEDHPPGEQYVAPYAAMSIAEHFMQHGRDVLVVLDELTKHARAYRELSLLLRRPPGREAFPGDIFYVHSRLLERSTHLREEFGGGSVTTMPIVETEAENLSAYIPTNLISITDGQIYLTPSLFDKGILPAVDIGKSVSRVGGKTQLRAFRTVAGDLRLSYAQFEELESFARFGTRLDVETRKTLERGRRVREIFKQPQYHPLSVAEQIAVLVAVNGGIFDEQPLGAVSQIESGIREAMLKSLPELCKRLESGLVIASEDYELILQMAREASGNSRIEK